MWYNCYLNMVLSMELTGDLRRRRKGIFYIKIQTRYFSQPREGEQGTIFFINSIYNENIKTVLFKILGWGQSSYCPLSSLCPWSSYSFLLLLVYFRLVSLVNVLPLFYQLPGEATEEGTLVPHILKTIFFHFLVFSLKQLKKSNKITPS